MINIRLERIHRLAHFWEGPEGVFEWKILPVILLHSCGSGCDVDSKSTYADTVVHWLVNIACWLKKNLSFVGGRPIFGLISRPGKNTSQSIFLRWKTSCSGEQWLQLRACSVTDRQSDSILKMKILPWSFLFIALGANIKTWKLIYLSTLC